MMMSSTMMMLQLQRFDLTLTYKKGKHLYLADTLSRAPRYNVSPQKAERPEFEVIAVHELNTTGYTLRALT